MNSIQQKNFQEYAKKINEIKEPISGAIGGILSYNKVEGTENYISAKFFNEKNKEITQNDIDNTTVFLSHYANQLKRLKKEINESLYINEDQKNLLKNMINGYVLRIILFKCAIYIEAEKGGYKLSPEDKEFYLRNVEKIENTIYGPKVSESPMEKDIIKNYLKKIFENNGKKLSQEQQGIFKDFFEKQFNEKVMEKDSKEQIEENNISSKELANIFKKILNIYHIGSTIVNINKEITEFKKEEDTIYIPGSRDAKQREDKYKELGIDKKIKIIIDPKTASIAVGENSITIPSSRQVNIKRACELIDHEINTHLLSNENNKKLLNIKSEGYLETQEGFAVLHEKLTTKKLQEINADEPTEHNIANLIAENYNFKDSKELFNIYYLLEGRTVEKAQKDATDRAFRTKRFHAFDQPGANRKDVAYRRGLSDVIEYMKNTSTEELKKQIPTFNKSKLSLEEIKKGENLFEGFEVKDEDIIMPIALGKILYTRIFGDKKEIQKFHESDPRFAITTDKQKLTNEQKRIYIEIEQFLKQKL